MSRHTHATLSRVALLGFVVACSDQPPTSPPPEPPPLPADLLGAAPAVGQPLRLLTSDQLNLFQAGSGVFQTVFMPENGLGPLFNSTGCASCHESPVVGGNGNNDPAEGGEDVELHATAFQGGACDDLSAVGGPVIQQQMTTALHDALGIDAEPVPVHATATGHRTTPSILGFGLLDAVSDEAILAYADPDDRDHDGISGRPNRFTDGRIGRFGRKAFVPTLR